MTADVNQNETNSSSRHDFWRLTKISGAPALYRLRQLGNIRKEPQGMDKDHNLAEEYPKRRKRDAILEERKCQMLICNRIGHYHGCKLQVLCLVHPTPVSCWCKEEEAKMIQEITIVQSSKSGVRYRSDHQPTL